MFFYLECQTEKHRGFAFVEYELPEDAKAAMDNMVSGKSLEMLKKLTKRIKKKYPYEKNE